MLTIYIMAWLKAHTSWGMGHGLYYGENEVEGMESMLNDNAQDVFYDWEANNDPNHNSEWKYFADEGRWYKVFKHMLEDAERELNTF
jgi:hypothetical protein